MVITKKTVQSWFEAVEPIMLEELGPAPWPYKIRSDREAHPFEVYSNQKRNTATLIYNPKEIESYSNDLVDKKNTKTDIFTILGGVISIIFHESVHLRTTYTSSAKYSYWSEGAAELLSIKILNNLYPKALEEDFEGIQKLEKEDISVFLTDTLSERRFKHSIEYYVASFIDDRFGIDTNSLFKKIEIIHEQNLSFPFQLNKKLTGLIKETLDEKHMYSIGTLALCELIKKEKLEVQELLNTPRTNAELIRCLKL